MVDIFPFVVERKAVYLQNRRFCGGELRVEVESVISIITRELEEYVKILSICPKYYRSEWRFDLQVFQFDPVNCLEELVGLDILFLPRITAESLLGVLLKKSLQEFSFDWPVLLLGTVDRVRIDDILSCQNHSDILFIDIEGNTSEHHLKLM